MAYADQEMSRSRLVAIIIVALIHVAIGYALVTGLAYSAMKQVIARVTTVDVTEPPPPDVPPPPPPPDTAPPPPVAPPPPISIAVSPPQIQTQANIPPPAPPAVIIPPSAPPAPPPPPPPPSRATPKGNPSSWASTEDYPARALRDEKQGVTSVSLGVGADGRVTSCSITSSSGTPELDQTTCTLLTRRGRFSPATQGGSPVASTWTTSIRWQIPR
ncbi:MAG: energy transducer TonB [Croceibacterium sp.]